MTCGIGFVNTPFRASRMIPMKKMIPRQTAVNSRAMATVNFGWAQSFESSVLCRCLYRSAGLLNALPDAKNAADNPVAKQPRMQPSPTIVAFTPPTWFLLFQWHVQPHVAMTRI